MDKWQGYQVLGLAICLGESSIHRHVRCFVDVYSDTGISGTSVSGLSPLRVNGARG